MVVDVTQAEQRQVDLIWQSWGNLTRFHRSMRIAVAREQDLWASVRGDVSSLRISTERKMLGGPYEVKLDEHLAAIGSTDVLNGLLLLQSWSLAEVLARVILKTDAPLGRVEDWAPKFLAPSGKTVGDLNGGLAPVVESYLARNAVAHAQPTWTAKMSERMEAVGGDAHPPDEWMDLSDAATDRHRLAARGLMNLSGLAATT